MNQIRDQVTVMGKMKADPRIHIVSLRIGSEDYKILERISEIHKICVSDIMREALQTLINSFRDSPMLGLGSVSPVLNIAEPRSMRIPEG